MGHTGSEPTDRCKPLVSFHLFPQGFDFAQIFKKNDRTLDPSGFIRKGSHADFKRHGVSVVKGAHQFPVNGPVLSFQLLELKPQFFRQDVPTGFSGHIRRGKPQDRCARGIYGGNTVLRIDGHKTDGHIIDKGI